MDVLKRCADKLLATCEKAVGSVPPAVGITVGRHSLTRRSHVFGPGGPGQICQGRFVYTPGDVYSLEGE
ncbi:MAG: hypothetical protein QGI83_19045 [Candidatus Latescibacteria bacterium]|nr:hypothetical protein [Candidatus Latescibacterota bacterium]